MSDDFLNSSDANRTAHASRYLRTVNFAEPLALEKGSTLPGVTVAYETYGTLNEARDNAILICHALTGDAHVARHEEADEPGWWEIMVGPGKPIDTDRFFVICPNILGGCRGTTGPGFSNPATGKPYGAEFPIITIGDIVEVQLRLIDHLKIGRLLAVVGGSLGGMMTLQWAARHPERTAAVVAIATSPRLSSQALAFDVVGRNAILRDPHFYGGQYYDQVERPDVGLAIARMLGHITYLSREAMTAKFDADRLRAREVQTQFETRFSVGSYLAYQGHRFVERFDPNSYLVLSMAMDLFDLGDEPSAIAAAFEQCRDCRWLLLSFTTDWLFPPFQARQMVDGLISLGRPVSYCQVASACGHDAFLLKDDFDRYGQMIRAFLANVDEPNAERGTMNAEQERVQRSESNPHPNPPPEYRERGPEPAGSVVEDAPDPTSIFHLRRLDYESILELIPPAASVLDVGCGNGGLLARLRERGGHARLVGVEVDEASILACLRRGLEVVHTDINLGLPAFADRQFDVVVLSQTLQTVREVDRVLSDLLRVGRRCIVSFPNVAYRRLRHQLAHFGRAPRGNTLQGYNWYDTPNVRFLSIADFQDYCRDRGIHIETLIALDTERAARVTEDPNLNADVAVVVLAR